MKKLIDHNLKKALIIIVVSVMTSSCNREIKSNEIIIKSLDTIDLHAERDFKILDSVKSHFCDYPEECEQYYKLNYWQKRKFEDKIVTKRVELALNFLELYPDDKNYYEVLKLFFNMHFEPRFLDYEISDSLNNFLSGEIKSGLSEHHERFRTLPFDTEARSTWIKKGYELGDQFLKTEASLENKLQIEIAMLARDLRHATVLYQNLDIQKEGLETAFWDQVDEHYWELHRLKLQNTLFKYAELEMIARYVKSFVNFIGEFSPKLKKVYWEKFLEITESEHLLANSPGFKAVYRMAKSNLEAIDKIDYSKPLEMKFTTIEGVEMNLADLRGKVVLIDFWSISCAPCIKEMPHIQRLYQKYRGMGFEVIGSSGDGDKSKEKIIKITEKQGATWPQYLDKSAKRDFSYQALHNIYGYPTLWLLNKEGIIVDRNARGERIEPLIKKHLGLTK